MSSFVHLSTSKRYFINLNLEVNLDGENYGEEQDATSTNSNKETIKETVSPLTGKAIGPDGRTGPKKPTSLNSNGI